ncbi:MAG: FliI/YscN family ATPase [Phycisphaerae bacterium]
MTLLASHHESLEGLMPMGITGRVSAISGMTIEAGDLPLPLGSLCRVHSFGGRTSLAEVIGFKDQVTLLMSLSGVAGVARGDRIENLASSPTVACSSQLLGRVIDGFGNPIDGLGPLSRGRLRRIDGTRLAPLDRHVIREPLYTSVRAIDAIHTCGLGQRMGIFSGPGVGKSTLLSQISQHTSADISVIALIGERGREVQDFLANSLGPEGLKRCVVIVSTGDDTPLLKVRAAKVACTVAEFFRDEGKHVLLLMDSLTRLAQAQRQIGLAAKEPPATKGFPPSVFAMLPEILERAGKTERGSITGFYTVLVEGDDFNEPVPDAVKGITDGHIWLSRKLAARGHFPAIDILQSISRVRDDVADEEMTGVARKVMTVLSVYDDIEDLVNIGAYVPGASEEYDLAVQARPRIIEFLKQRPDAPTTGEQAMDQLRQLGRQIQQIELTLKTRGKQKLNQQAAQQAAQQAGGR